MSYRMKQLNQSRPKRIARLLCCTVHKIANRGLAAANFFSDLWLRHLAVTLDFGNNVFPVHGAIITAFRYFANVFLISIFRKLRIWQLNTVHD